jgi:hypothetical protein
MQISWDELGRPEQPGQIRWRDGLVQVEAKHIQLWREHPEARFTVAPIQTMDEPRRYLLASVNYTDSP